MIQEAPHKLKQDQSEREVEFNIHKGTSQRRLCIHAPTTNFRM